MTCGVCVEGSRLTRSDMQACCKSDREAIAIGADIQYMAALR